MSKYHICSRNTLSTSMYMGDLHIIITLCVYSTGLYTDNAPKRLHLITTKDISNIERSYGINSDHIRHQDDATSVKLWIEDMKSTESNNPVLLYEPQEMEGTEFLLVLQSLFQANMLKILCSGKTVCVDVTHGTNSYGFHLTTVVVIDEYGEGFPAAWCISSHIDTNTLRKFFEVIKKNVGEIQPAWLMSDDASQFYNAWIASFEHVPKHILCKWHVLRAWKNKLKVINDIDKEEETYHILKVLIDEHEPNKFKALIDGAVRKFKEDIKVQKFVEYFERYYKPRCTEWASCYRISSGVNTNMYTEAFHHVLKYNFLCGKKNKRLDKLIQALMEYLRQKSFDRLIKFEKGKITGRISLIQKRHTTSQSLSISLVTAVDSTSWIVQSEMQSGMQYTVEELSKKCSSACATKCRECCICVHSYSCTCPDSLLQHTICKHVHLVVRYKKSTTTGETSSSLISQEAEDFHDDMHSLLLQEVSQAESHISLEQRKSKIMKIIQDVTCLVTSSTSEDGLKTAEKMLITVKNNLTASAVYTPFPANSKFEPANKGIEKQRPFKAVKTKRKCNIRFTNPSLHESNCIKAMLDFHLLDQVPKPTLEYNTLGMQ